MTRFKSCSASKQCIDDQISKDNRSSIQSTIISSSSSILYTPTMVNSKNDAEMMSSHISNSYVNSNDKCNRASLSTHAHHYYPPQMYQCSSSSPPFHYHTPLAYNQYQYADSNSPMDHHLITPRLLSFSPTVSNSHKTIYNRPNKHHHHAYRLIFSSPLNTSKTNQIWACCQQHKFIFYPFRLPRRLIARIFQVKLIILKNFYLLFNATTIALMGVI